MRCVSWILTMLLATASLHAAEKPLSGAIIVVDPGHGGQTYSKSYTGGATGTGSKLTESELNLRVGLALAKILKDEGATVHLTRTADHRLSRTGSSSKEELHSRVEFFEHHACHFFISVHHNAAATEGASGHTAIYKHNAEDDTLYEALAREVNDALATAVPGPKRRLIKENYHLTRETRIPGTITEAGFMTNKAFDTLSNDKDFPAKEATALAAGAVTYWRTHQAALKELRAKLVTAREAAPKDPTTYTNIALNPDHQSMMSALRAKIAPDGNYDAAKAAEYLAAFRKIGGTPVSDLQVRHDGTAIRLSGKLTDRKEHDAFLDLLVGMKLLAIVNDCSLPKP